jgi:TonB family protein
MTDSATYFEFQVERQAYPVPGNPSPRYPDMLREAGVDGQVLAQFVVDTTGRANMLTFKVLKTSHDLFTASVRSALPNMTFAPAEVGGKKVKQLIQMPFEFSMGHSTNGQLQPVVTTAREAEALKASVAKTSPVQVVGVPARGVAPKALPEGTYFEYQVTKAVSPQPGNNAPRYPDVLRQANIEGEVLAQFIVDETGAPIMSSFGVLKSSHDLFSVTVHDALPTMRFHPAELNGRTVKQLVQMPFKFSLSKN